MPTQFARADGDRITGGFAAVRMVANGTFETPGNVH